MKSTGRGTRTEASNPTGPTELSVQVLQNNNKTKSSTYTDKKKLKVEPELLNDTKNYKMRDLYHRHDKLAYWIHRVNAELEEPDKTDVLKLVEHMQDRERAVLWITRCITALLLMRKQLGKAFRDANKDDIRNVLKWMEQKSYKASTNEKFRQVLKLFYKIVYGNNEYYPEQIKWFSVKLGKEKSGKETSMDMAEFWEEGEVQKLIDSAPTLQKKTFLACMYESGSRAEEFLRLTSLDLRIDTNGAVLVLRGKTGERLAIIYSYLSIGIYWYKEWQ